MVHTCKAWACLYGRSYAYGLEGPMECESKTESSGVQGGDPLKGDRTRLTLRQLPFSKLTKTIKARHTRAKGRAV